MDLVVATDVTNPLLGPEGAAAVFGPQKGATPDRSRGWVEAALTRYAEVVAAYAGRGHSAACRVGARQAG